jgi:2-oxoglutarate ferredoxin oxidoreductase subunit delta
VKKSYEVEINYSWCKSCGICYSFCPTGAIGKGNLLEPVVSDEKKCIGCLMCENLCPDFAIVIKEKQSVQESAQNG